MQLKELVHGILLVVGVVIMVVAVVQQMGQQVADLHILVELHRLAQHQDLEQGMEIFVFRMLLHH